MTHLVQVTQRAKRDLQSAHRRAAVRAPATADRWLRRFKAALGTLADNPERCSLAPESEIVGAEIRQFLFGKKRNTYRALFKIEGNEVRVLHVRWAGRDFATAADLEDP